MATLLKIVFILPALLSTALAEFFFAYRRRDRAYLKHLVTNVTLWIINTLLNPILITASAFALSWIGWHWRPTWLQIESAPILIVALDILIIDAFIYVWHRANHVIPFLWRFHQVHHADTIMDFTTGVRFHFGEVALSAVFRLIIIVVFDIALLSVVIAETLLLVMSIFQHGNFRMPQRWERIMSKVLITPGLHWVHHHQIRKDTDSNYGNIFSFWDLIGKSRSPIRRFEGMPIGIEGEHKEGSIWQQIKRPFIS